ncbi:hypothetical protein PsorP6_010780 [Peronosclerospora sorghi]|uniref:Uncharacterized protein n=1 Tax=Peronosclerospora sorghi TaxID=230839 RepID=A0ACC0VUI3_9STRA|nr:hypothetical protein PsorP6_010780 [Peronosclerospora sorghi]
MSSGSVPRQRYNDDKAAAVYCKIYSIASANVRIIPFETLLGSVKISLQVMSMQLSITSRDTGS